MHASNDLGPVRLNSKWSPIQRRFCVLSGPRLLLFARLVSVSGEYFTYLGSSTSPPAEGVCWARCNIRCDGCYSAT